VNEHDPPRSAASVPPTQPQAPSGPAPTKQAQDATAPRDPVQDARPVPTDDAPPDVPGYELLGLLGEGGMGLVYRAREIAFDRDVAVKVLKAKYRVDSPVARQFLEEARITAQLQHPAIPPVHHIGTLPDGRPFLAMKLIKGDSLAKRLAVEGAVWSRLVPAFAQVCHAVAYAHSRKVIHRDLKPANIMVGAFGEVLVMDWGLAKVLGTPDAPKPKEPVAGEATEIRTGREPDSATQAGIAKGTPAYMPPEQAGGEVDKIDERADVFGLGAVLCVLLTGKPPYDAPTTESVLLKAIRGETELAFARLDDCGADAELIALCKRCLSREPDARPRNASEVASEVAAHLAAVEERARQAELERARSEVRAAEEAKTREQAEARVSEQRKRRRAQRALAGSVLLLLAVVGVGAVFAHLWRTSESAKDEAESQRVVAEGAQGVAIKAQQSEEAARKEVENEREALAMSAYGRTIQVAHQEWRDGNTVAMRALLGSTTPKLRGWEWHYLHQLQDPSLFTLKHTSAVLHAAYSADSKHVFTWSSDGTAKAWDAKTGTERSDTGASFNADGTRIASGGNTKIRDPKIVGELFAPEGHKRVASFSPDGKRIVTASDDNTAKVWDAETGAVVRTLEGHTQSVNAAAFSADGKRIVTASGDRTAKVWDAKTGAELLTFKGHTNWVQAASFSADGKRIVTASDDNTAKVWDAETGAVVRTLEGHTQSVNAAAFSADGKRIVTASGDRTAKVWNAETGDELRALKEHSNPVFSASFSPDGTHIVTAGFDQIAKVWNAKTGAAVRTLKGHTARVHTASFSADGLRIVTASSDGTAKVWDAPTLAEPTLSGDGLYPTSTAFSPDGNCFVTGHGNGMVRVWNAKTGGELDPLKDDGNWVRAVSFSADGTRIVVGREESSTLCSVSVLDSKTGARRLTLKDLQGSAAALSADGAYIVTGGVESDLDSKFKFPTKRLDGQVWDVRTGAKVFALEGHASGLNSASFSGDGTRIVTGSSDTTAKVWNAKTGAELLTLRGHTKSVNSTSFNADGTRIVTGSSDTTAKVWDAKTGAEVLTLKGHTNAVHVALFSADRTRIVTGSADGTARLWDVQTGAEVFTVKGPAWPITVASFSSDVTRIVTDSSDGIAKFAPLPLGALPPRPK
jgi:WD40 repeat protein/serine/threonine protein kinase